VGPAVGLFENEFYKNVHEALHEDGIMAAQSESPFLEEHRPVIKEMHRDLSGFFPLVRLYLAFIPVYQTGMWSFTIASKKYDPLKVRPEDIMELKTRYYNTDIHTGAFALPSYVREMLADA
jgi:spermidine synthase